MSRWSGKFREMRVSPVCVKKIFITRELSSFRKTEIAMVFRVIEEVLVPIADKIEALLNNPTLDDVWINDMCRFLFLVKSSLSGLATGFWLEDQTLKTGGKEIELW